jgi:hypothetical protein
MTSQFYNRKIFSQVPVAHAYNPSYSGGRVQENHSLKPAWANSSRDPILKNPSHKNMAGRVAQGEGPELQKKKKKIVAPVLQKKYSKISNPGHPECYFLQVFD